MSEGLYLVLALGVIVSYLLITAPSESETYHRRAEEINQITRNAMAEMDRVAQETMSRFDAARRK